MICMIINSTQRCEYLSDDDITATGTPHCVFSGALAGFSDPFTSCVFEVLPQHVQHVSLCRSQPHCSGSWAEKKRQPLPPCSRPWVNSVGHEEANEQGLRGHSHSSHQEVPQQPEAQTVPGGGSTGCTVCRGETGEIVCLCEWKRMNKMKPCSVACDSTQQTELAVYSINAELTRRSMSAK